MKFIKRLLGFKSVQKKDSDYIKINKLKFEDYSDVDLILRYVIDIYNEIWKDISLYDINLTEAKFHLEKLNSLNPNNSKILTNLGAILSDKGKHQEALKYLLKAEKICSKDRNLSMNIGIVKMGMENERPNAKKHFEKAESLTPNELTIEAYFDPHAH